MRCLFYGPERQKPVIKFTTMNMRAGSFTNNAVTINYTNSTGNFQANVGMVIYAYYANNQLMANGTINKASYQSAANTGTLQVNTIFGSFANATTIFTTANGFSAQINAAANGFINGIYNNQGLLLPNPAVAEFITGQPGMTANGQATTNVADSVNYTLVNNSTDDYGFASAVYGLAFI